MKFKRLVCAVLAVVMVGLNFGGFLSVSAADEAGRAVIPFDKIWEGETGLAYEAPRPDSIMVSLYKYTGDFDQDTATLVETANVSAPWHYDFDISSQSLFDEDGEAYKFKVVESSVSLYNETAHVDPTVEFIPPEGSDNWVKHAPCNELEITNTTADKHPIVASEKGHTMVVWSPTPLTPVEREAIHDSLVHQHGVGNPTYLYISGEGEFTEYGITVTSEKVIYDNSSDWSLIYFGKYKPTASSITEASVTNTHEVEYTSLTFNKVWDDDNNRDGKRETVTAGLFVNGKAVDGKTKEITTEDGKTYKFDNLPKCSGYVDAVCQKIEYSVKEIDLDEDYYTARYQKNEDGTITITNIHSPEKVKLLIQKTWGGANKANKVTFRITGGDVDMTVDLSESDKVEGKCEEWCKEVEADNMYRYENGQEIEYDVEEESIDGGGFVVYDEYETEEGEKSVKGKWNTEKTGSNNKWTVKNTWVSADYRFDGSSVFYIKKIDQDGKPMAEVEFNVNGDTKTTDAEGRIEIIIPEALSLKNETKNYVIKETHTQEGYDLDSGEAGLEVVIESEFTGFDSNGFVNIFSKKFTFTASGNRNYDWDAGSHTFTLKNKRSMADSLTIKKTFSGVSASDLENLTFTIVGPADFGVNSEMTLSFSNDCVISGTVATCVVNGNVPTGEYTVKENEAEVEGFELSVSGDNETKDVKKGDKVVFEIENIYEEIDPCTDDGGCGGDIVPVIPPLAPDTGRLIKNGGTLATAEGKMVSVWVGGVAAIVLVGLGLAFQGVKRKK